MKKTLSNFALLLPLLLWQTGCAGYRLGSMLPTDIASVYVPTVVNKTAEPLIEIDVTQAIIQNIQQDGSLRVVSAEEADTILTVELTGYELEAVAFRKDVRAAANQYRINLTANMVLRRTSDESVVAESPRVAGSAVFDVLGDLSSSKLTGNPDAADDLATRIVQRIVEYW
jgi:hypothetical protein